MDDSSLECFILLQMLNQCVTMAKVMVSFKGPIPPPFPNGKGAGRLMAVTVFCGKVSVENGFSFSPLGETGEG